MFLDRIAGWEVRELAERFGTPTFIYDAEKIVARIENLRDFPLIRYAQKACSNLAVLDLMRRHDVLVDAVSAGEIFRAFRAGYAPGQIVYTADIFDHPALDLVVRHEIRVNCGSADMIRQLGKVAPGREITLRINPGFGHGHSQKTNTGGAQSKHGIWHEQLPDCIRLAKENDLTVTGIHLHIGSGTDMEHLAQVCSAMVRIAGMVGDDLRNISAGGGLPIPYRQNDPELDVPAFAKLWLQAKAELEQKVGHPVELELEPGRYLVADCGYLIAEIRAIKTMGENTFYLLNAGFNNLARPILYGAYHPMFLCRADGSTDTSSQAVVVGGPLCESGDIFTQREGGYVETRELPAAKVGDFVVIGNCGAYAFVMGSNYNSMPLAAEVLIRAQTPYLVRQRQSLEDLVSGESIPPLAEV